MLHADCTNHRLHTVQTAKITIIEEQTVVRRRRATEQLAYAS
jgi:hypothetical protein